MTPELMQAHGALDAVIDEVFGLGIVPDESKRQEALFDTYVTILT